jgi:hypothetical protein
MKWSFFPMESRKTLIRVHQAFTVGGSIWTLMYILAAHGWLR